MIEWSKKGALKRAHCEFIEDKDVLGEIVDTIPVLRRTTPRAVKNLTKCNREKEYFNSVHL